MVYENDVDDDDDDGIHSLPAPSTTTAVSYHTVIADLRSHRQSTKTERPRFLKLGITKED